MRPADLLSRIVSVPSMSGDEHGLLNYLEGYWRDGGVEPERMGRNLLVRHGSGAPTLWLNAHIDTVAPADGYTFDPYCGTITDDGRVLGLGANDTKGSVAAQMIAFERFRKVHPDPRGTLILVQSCDEETGGEGVEWLRQALPKPDAVLIGEPNQLAVANCCKGLVRARIVVRGASAHASRPWQGRNAMRLAMPVLERLMADHAFPEDPLLGPATLEVTLISGGHVKNALPDLVTVTLDGRTVPGYDNAAMVAMLNGIVESCGDSELEVVSDRLRATSTPATGRLVRAACAARGADAPVAFGGVCDLVHVGDCDAVVMGPGEPERSHRADEFLMTAELEQGIVAYTQTLERYFNE